MSDPDDKIRKIAAWHARPSWIRTGQLFFMTSTLIRLAPEKNGLDRGGRWNNAVTHSKRTLARCRIEITAFSAESEIEGMGD